MRSDSEQRLAEGERKGEREGGGETAEMACYWEEGWEAHRSQRLLPFSRTAWCARVAGALFGMATRHRGDCVAGALSMRITEGAWQLAGKYSDVDDNVVILELRQVRVLIFYLFRAL